MSETWSKAGAAFDVKAMLELVEYLDRHHPPPPKPDMDKCLNCKEEMSGPAMAVTSGVGVFAPAVGYLCGRCAYLFKQKYHYDVRNAVSESVDRHIGEDRA